MSGHPDEWFDRADDDLKFAEVGLREGFYAQVCFLSQQGIEKCLKGALIAQGKNYPQSHNLRDLARNVDGIPFEKWREDLTIIDGYYVPARYPDAMAGTKATGTPTRKEAHNALSFAHIVFETIISLQKKR